MNKKYIVYCIIAKREETIFVEKQRCQYIGEYVIFISKHIFQSKNAMHNYPQNNHLQIMTAAVA